MYLCLVRIHTFKCVLVMKKGDWLSMVLPCEKNPLKFSIYFFSLFIIQIMGKGQFQKDDDILQWYITEEILQSSFIARYELVCLPNGSREFRSNYPLNLQSTLWPMGVPTVLPLDWMIWTMVFKSIDFFRCKSKFLKRTGLDNIS